VTNWIADFADHYRRVRRGDKSVQISHFEEYVVTLFLAYHLKNILPAPGGMRDQNPRLMELFNCLIIVEKDLHPSG
jgi:hypothetical protein